METDRETQLLKQSTIEYMHSRDVYMDWHLKPQHKQSQVFGI